MNDSGLCELRPLDVVNSSTLWMMSMILGLEPKVLNIMNNSRV